MRSPRRRLLVPLALLLGALALAELGARVLAARAWRPLPPFGSGAPQAEWLARSGRELSEGRPPPGYSQFDAELGWSTRPGHVSADGTIHINAQGLRATREYAATRPSGMRRVLACGESFTFGEEVADAETWSARLEARVPALEVLNYGVGGYGTDQALLRVAREARGPIDALLVGLMLENIGRNVNRYRPLWYPSAQPAAKPRYVLGAGGLELVPQPYASLPEFVAAVESGRVFADLSEHEHWSDGGPPPWLAWSSAARLWAGQRAYAARELAPLWSDVEGAPFRTTLALLEAFRAEARALGSEHVLVLVFPLQSDLERLAAGGERTWTPLLAALDARGLAHLDLSEALAAAVRAGTTVAELYLQSHFSPRANDLVAEAVATRLSAAGAPLAPR